MSTELVKADAYAQASLDERRAYVATIAQAGDLLPRALWASTRNADGSMNPPAPSPAKVLLLAETGSMLGLHPMAALQSIHIIEGKPTLSANLLAALVRRAGHRLRVTTKGSWRQGTFVARAELTRADDPDFTYVVEWDKERADRAGLLGKDVWKKYGEAMCKSRAITEVIREGAPDVTIIAAYTPEELGEANVTEDGDVVLTASSAEPVSSPASAPEAPQSAAHAPAQASGVGFSDEDAAGWFDRAAAARTVDELGAIWAEAAPLGGLRAEQDGVMLGTVLQNLKKRFEEAPPTEVVQDAEVIEDEPAGPVHVDDNGDVQSWTVAPIPNGDES